MDIKMLARSVGSGGEITVADLEAIPDYEDELAPGGTAHIVIRDPDLFDQFEQGQVYTLTFAKASAADAGVFGQTAALAAAAAAIPNSTNTRDYRTPAELRVPPPTMPDGVVTLPRPSVVLPPVTDTPPDAGVVSGPPTNPGPESQAPQAPKPADEPKPAATPPKSDGDKK